ncbi:MAG: VWA domain-containing protein [bacterium]|nr:VWA domain-containing protein [bacterium]
MKKTLFLRIIIVLSLLFNFLSGFPSSNLEPVRAQESDPICPEPQPVQKLGESIPPGNDLFPGSDVKVTLRVEGGCSQIRTATDIILVLDVTGSMNFLWGPCPIVGGVTRCDLRPTKLDSAKAALTSFVNKTNEDKGATDPGDYVGLATYAGPTTCTGNGFGGCKETTLCPSLTSCATLVYPISNMTNANKTALINAINSVTAKGSTTIGSGVRMGNDALINRRIADAAMIPPRSAMQVMVLATDGNQNTVPSPFEAGIMSTTINQKFLAFSIGIGDDAKTASTPIGTYCSGCPDGISSVQINPDGRSSGEEVMKDIACRTDQIDPDTTKRCNFSDKVNKGPAVNNEYNPRNYFYAAGDAQLTTIYNTIIGRLQLPSSYLMYEAPNVCTVPGDSTSCNSGDLFISYYWNPSSVKIEDCSTPGVPWPTGKVVLIGPRFFFVGFTNVPVGKTVCVSFVAKIRDDDAFIALLAGDEANFDLNNPRSRLAAVDPRKPECDYVFECLRDLNSSPITDINEGSATVKSPAFGWLKTDHGNVGSFTDMQLRRNLAIADPTEPYTLYNTEYLGISNGSLNSPPNYFFRSFKKWVVPNYTNLNVYPNVTVGGSIYDKLLADSEKRCVINTLTNDTPGAVSSAASGTCKISRYTSASSFDIDSSWSSTYSGNSSIVFIENADLLFSEDLRLAAGKGLIFVVKKQIRIVNDGADRIDAVLISDGQFISSRTSCTTPNVTSDPLTVNGAIYVFGSRAAGENAACFNRVLTNNFTDPSEIINYDPRYLYLFREIIGNSRPVYSELAP